MLSIRKESILFAACVGLAACTQPDPAFSGLEDCEVDVPLQELAESTSFADLVHQTGAVDLTGAVIADVSHVIAAPSGYVVLDQRVGNQAWLAMAEGDVVQNLGQPGRGPGEYQRLRDAAVAGDGSIYVLSSQPAKILAFSPDGVYLEEWSLAELGLQPEHIIVTGTDPFTAILHVLHPDSWTAMDGHQAAIVSLHDGALRIDARFGRSESTLQRLYFSSGGFLMTAKGDVWIHPVFEHGMDMYHPESGQRLGGAESVSQYFEAPLISPEMFDGYSRVREALDTYGAVSRLVWQLPFNDLVMSYFTEGRDAPKHLFFHDACGRDTGVHIAADAFPVLNRVVGTTDGGRRFFLRTEIDADADTGFEIWEVR